MEIPYQNILVFQEFLGILFALIVTMTHRGSVYYILAILYGGVGFKQGGPVGILIAFFYVLQVVYNNKYLLTEKTNASGVRIFIENLILYHSPLMIFGIIELLNLKVF